MKTFSARLLLSIIGAALASTSSFAQSPNLNGGGYSYNRYSYESGSYGAGPGGQPLYDAAPGYNGPYASGTYPNPVTRSGSASSTDSGAGSNLDRGYPAFYGFTDE